MTYKAVGRSIADYAAPVWSTNASNTSMEKIQVAQNEALRISTGAHKMSSIDHLHCEAQMLKVTEHSDLLSAQYLVKCLDHENVCHNITTLDEPPRMMKHTLYSKHHTTIKWIGREDDPQCKDCGFNNQDVNHLFDCPAHPTVMSPTKLWSLPADTIGEFAYLDPERLD